MSRMKFWSATIILRDFARSAHPAIPYIDDYVIFFIQK